MESAPTFITRCEPLIMGVYIKVSVRGCFSKDFQSSLWPGKKYAPAMPVYLNVYIKQALSSTLSFAYS